MKKITYQQLKQEAENTANFLHTKIQSVRSSVDVIQDKVNQTELPKIAKHAAKSCSTMVKIMSVQAQNKYLEYKIANKKN